ncbi:hypothetical protein T07_5575 [Trichinella nelsoni]|uniref:Uncharacterized protein n=1 Tax=Trichinella nelsoni TaxID=6336 RepID=A0A0V0S537_9BILA|nr:hypothetical protein T07_5575 [Trichinella nelsoni]
MDNSTERRMTGEKCIRCSLALLEHFETVQTISVGDERGGGSIFEVLHFALQLDGGGLLHWPWSMNKRKSKREQFTLH